MTIENIPYLILISLISYIIGSFPTAVIISKTFFGFDLRQKGSGNMGSTNAFRVLGWKWGIIVMIIDIGKGFIAAYYIADLFGKGISFPGITNFDDITIVRFVAGVFAVIGHIWSVFVKFKGGKGINTSLGMMVGIAPVDMSIAVGFFILAVILSGYISLGSIAGAFALPSSMFIRYNLFGVNVPGYGILVYCTLVLFLLIVYTHRHNIMRLIKGTENRFSKLQLIKVKSYKK